MALSNSSLALLTALFAVCGLVLPPLYSFLVPTSVSVLGTTEDQHLLVLVTNRTRTAVYLERAELSAATLPQGPYALSPVGEDGAFVDRDRKAFPPGSTSVRLRPSNSLVLDHPPDASTAFTLHVGIQPSRPWSREQIMLTSIQDFACTWGDNCTLTPEASIDGGRE
jgi:hypothetical protein